jgi:uncharacterized protein (DUF486 family)
VEHGGSVSVCSAPMPAAPLAARLTTPALLFLSNLFMTYAWYGHLKDAKNAPLWTAIMVSWGVAFLEYCLQVPANRIGFQEAGYSLQQLKVMQEVITMAVFAAFAVLYMKERITLDFLWASICLAAAAWFMFRGVRAPG